MRAVIVAGVVVAGLAAPAAAERRQAVSWKDVCVLALMLWDDHRLEMTAQTGTTIGGGAWGHDAVGAAARYGITENVVVGVEARRQLAREREPAAMLDTPARAGAASLSVGYRVVTGRLDLGTRLPHRFDVVTSIGPGVVLAADGPHAAIAFDVTMRVFLTDWLTLDLGIHDDAVVRSARGVAARAIEPTETAALPTHAIEARAGLGVWWPARPHYRCKRFCR
jgi:hypothetical protein